jgi:hypothetical protein
MALHPKNMYIDHLPQRDHGTDLKGKCIEFCQNTKKVGIIYSFKIGIHIQRMYPGV